MDHPLEKIKKNIDFSLLGKQCSVLPKWTFYFFAQFSSICSLFFRAKGQRGKIDDAILLAASMGHLDIVKMCQSKGADTEIRSPENGATPLINAAEVCILGIQIQNPKMFFNFLASTIGFRNES